MKSMEQLANEIRPGFADSVINARLAEAASEKKEEYTLHFNQNEEFFVQLQRSYTVPSFPIHHDVRQTVPRTDYSNALRDCMEQILAVAPPFFSDLSYFFDPTEILKPCFYRLYRIDTNYYLYLMRINLLHRPLESETFERGSNDSTAVYSSNKLYLESDVIPLASVISELGKLVAFVIKQTISQTWIGETGKGYLVRGIWMDMELTKFFTKLFLPKGKRSYPLYPYTCKYKTLCMSIPDPVPEKRRFLLPYLHTSLELIQGSMESIQEALKNETFSEELPVFKELKKNIPESVLKPWTNISVIPYLNAEDQKEFRIEV